jgi:hypothetical protein
MSSEAQYDAAFEAYYKAVGDWRVVSRSGRYVIERDPKSFNPNEMSEETITEWRFEDKITADRFLVTKLLEAIVDAVVECKC